MPSEDIEEDENIYSLIRGSGNRHICGVPVSDRTDIPDPYTHACSGCLLQRELLVSLAAQQEVFSSRGIINEHEGLCLRDAGDKASGKLCRKGADRCGTAGLPWDR